MPSLSTHHLATLKLSAVMLALYAATTGALIILNHQLGTWHPDVAWPVYWIIWLFAYWPIALAAFACFAILHPSRRLALTIHLAYIVLALIVMQLALSLDTSWPLVILKITGLIFAFTCITALPRNANT